MHPRTFLTQILLLTVFCTSCLALDWTALASADEPGQISYRVDLADAKNHYVNVQLTTTAKGNRTELMMAVWTPGSYLVREYARHIDSLKVTDTDGNELPFRKIRKNRWLVEVKANQQFIASYRLYCNEVTVRTNFVGHRYAVLNGAPTFLTIADRLDQPHHVSLQMPDGWQKSASSMAAGKKPNTYSASNFDELVDSPIVAGLVDVYPFEAGGVPHQLVNVGESGYWDGTAVATDLKKIVEQHQNMWGTVPYDRYLFINVIAEGRGGLEHDSSTLVLSSRWAFRVPEKYQDWLSLASHEFFHTWNVRRLRPQPLMKYDYENEIYTECLWIAEGITNYYEDLALVRGGLIDRKEFLKRISKKIEKVQAANGRKIQSLRDASYDTWIKFYRRDENSPNTQVSYYAKGAIVAFLLDVEIRRLTKNEKCLDDVMRAMYKKFLDTGYTQANFSNTASEIAGADLTAWFEHTVNSTRELDYEPALQFLGLEFGEEDKKDDGTDEADESADQDANTDSDEEEKEGWIGVKLEGQTVSQIVTDSPATDAGINWDDKIIAVNGFQIHESLDTHLKQFAVGDEIDLLVSRNGELVTLTTKIAEKPEAKWTLYLIAQPSEQQAQSVDSWLQDQDSQAKSKEQAEATNP